MTFYESNQTNHNYNQLTKYQIAGFTIQSSVLAFLIFALVLLFLVTYARPIDHQNVVSFKEMHERLMRRHERAYKN